MQANIQVKAKVQAGKWSDIDGLNEAYLSQSTREALAAFDAALKIVRIAAVNGVRPYRPSGVEVSPEGIALRPYLSLIRLCDGGMESVSEVRCDVEEVVELLGE